MGLTHFVAVLAVVLSVSGGSSAQSVADQSAISPITSSQLRPVKQTVPVYPPIAKAAHVSGEVVLRVEIAPDGHVLSATKLSGPAMLVAPAIDSVKQWTYEPATAGDTTTRFVTATVPFTLAAPANPDDQKNAAHFFPLQQACVQAVSVRAPSIDEVAACQRAADVAERFGTGERYIERRSIFVYTATAMVRDHQTTEALRYANKAVAVVEQGHDDASGSAAAYSVKAQAEAQGGQLEAASADLVKAERFEHDAIQRIMPDAPGLTQHEYVPALRNLLKFHAQILSALGKPEQAAEKTKEADAL